MKLQAQNQKKLRVAFLCASVLGLGALSGCISITGPMGECMERSGTFFGLFHQATSFNERCANIKLAETMMKAPFPDVVEVGIKFRADQDPAFSKLIEETAKEKLAEVYNKKAQGAVPVECAVGNVRLVGDYKEFNLTGCKPVAPVVK